MKTHRILAIVIIIVCAMVLSCQALGKVMDVGAQLAEAAGIVDTITPEQEYYIGRAVAANILSTYKIWEGNPAMTAYLNKICMAIAINSPRPDLYNGYYVMILDSNEINAFATPGGHIFVTRGLVASANSEDALAGVIAHEIAHIQLQHSIKAIKTNRITQAILVTGVSAAGAAAGYDLSEMTDIFNESVGEIVTTMVNNGYSQSQEFDADNVALNLLAAAGYSPSGLIDMLNELNKMQGSQSGGFNKTHPTPAQRLSNAEKAIGRHQVADTRSARQTRFNAATR
ncbi:MAG: M48 family metalloprotease [Treponema sp.]|nr:M48 family metalloprotease [Treponema sp.]